ncbi:MAG: 16S rRNA (uracil(1498)-N(3))-methyltransferase [Candidatus Omnitrophica bacterium]|nr:16S rRNA (uracil(1498)-N(3))-methyltransferase [Candidatus Omnitrophota bacterium]
MNPPRTRLFSVNAGQSHLILEDADSLQVRRVLRLQQGDWIACFNGDGMEYVYRIEDSNRRALTLSLQSSAPNPRDDIPPAAVLIASTKGKTKDRIVRDIPPLGITSIIFYRADRSVCRPQIDAQPRLQKIAVESCRQCGRSSIPEVIVSEKPLSDLFQSAAMRPAESLLFWENAGPNAEWRPGDYRHSANLIFGPEGGFSGEEIAWIQSQNIPAASLGSRILRSELAAVVGVVLLQSKRGLLR